MHKILSTSVSRRSLLKLGAVAATLLSVPLWGSKASAQSASNAVPKQNEIKPSGLVSYNAGWAIPIEDKSALLALEEKKTKEAQAAAPSTTAVGADAPAKPVNKSLADKVQDAWNKVKGFF